MISKEEIENILTKYHGQITNRDLKNLKEYIQQLENKQQKVIDYLEKEIEENRECMKKTNIKLNQLHYMKRIEYAKEILEIIRGET